MSESDRFWDKKAEAYAKSPITDSHRGGCFSPKMQSHVPEIIEKNKQEAYFSRLVRC